MCYKIKCAVESIISVGRKVLDTKVKGFKRKGRPKKKCMDCVKEDIVSKLTYWSDTKIKFDKGTQS